MKPVPTMAVPVGATSKSSPVVARSSGGGQRLVDLFRAVRVFRPGDQRLGRGRILERTDPLRVYVLGRLPDDLLPGGFPGQHREVGVRAVPRPVTTFLREPQ